MGDAGRPGDAAQRVVGAAGLPIRSRSRGSDVPLAGDRAGPLRPPTGATSSRQSLPERVCSGLADVSAHTERLGPIQVYAGSTRGVAHQRMGGVREDAYALSAGCKDADSDQDRLIVAISDGLGSSRDAHAAAAAITRIAVDQLRVPSNSGWDAEVDDVVAEIDRHLREPRLLTVTGFALGSAGSTESQAEECKTDPQAAATLVAARCEVEPTGGLRVAWMSVGDSKLLTLDLATGQWTWCSGHPKAHRGSGTDALPRPSRPADRDVVLVGPLDVVVLATDGAWKALYRMPEEFANVLRSVWDEPTSAAKFATVLDFSGPGLTDDRTIVAVRLAGLD